MEFTNEIFFNKKLIQGESVVITYSGKLYKEYSSEVTIVYGFGDNWDYTQETKMQEKENGFEALITLKDYNTFNFCFKNNYNIWDNNSGFNYIATVETAPEIEEVEIKEEQTTQTTEEIPQTTENKVSTEQVSQEVDSATDIEKAFSELLDSILQFSQNEANEEVNLDNGFGLQAVDEVEEISEVSEEKFTSCDDLFQEMYDDLTSNFDEETKVKNAETISAPQKIEQSTESSEISTDLESLLNDFSERQEQKSKTITASELDEIMENILNSVIEDAPNESAQETTNTLPAVQGEKRDFLDVCIDSTVSFFGYVGKAFKKLGILLKETVKELFTENE